MAVAPLLLRVQSSITTTPSRLARVIPLARKAAVRVSAATATARLWLDLLDAPTRSAVEQVTNAWWSAVDWTLLRPFVWAVAQARRGVLTYRWDLDARADRLQAWACALEALAHAYRAWREHPDIAEDDGVVEPLENQAALLRAVATADWARFLREQREDTSIEDPTRRPASRRRSALISAS